MAGSVREYKDLIRNMGRIVGLLHAIQAAYEANEETRQWWAAEGLPLPQEYHNIRIACEELKQELQ